MERYSKNGDTLKGIKIVYGHPSETKQPDTLKSSAGRTVKKGPIRLVGWMMSNIERWLVEERSYAITGVGVLLFSLFIGTILGMFLGIKYDRSRLDIVSFGNQQFKLIGMAKIADNNGKDVFAPVYEGIPK